MKPWIIDRIENDRRESEWKPVPLRIQQPPPEWLEEQRRRQERDAPSHRGVTIIGGDEPSDRGVFIIDM
ncbi:MAG: hypothetical protein KDA24_10180 [Deltaproteobacteria bacterium]|nr:hypothetical protein [Deltaproteobacteria bacterium]